MKKEEKEKENEKEKEEKKKKKKNKKNKKSKKKNGKKKKNEKKEKKEDISWEQFFLALEQFKYNRNLEEYLDLESERKESLGDFYPPQMDEKNPENYESTKLLSNKEKDNNSNEPETPVSTEKTSSNTEKNNTEVTEEDEKCNKKTNNSTIIGNNLLKPENKDECSISYDGGDDQLNEGDIRHIQDVSTNHENPYHRPINVDNEDGITQENVNNIGNIDSQFETNDTSD